MNISFLNPAVLWLLPLSLVPVILHLFFRKNPGKIYFSDLRFIRAALENVQSRFRLRHYLLLAVRALIVACIFLFFAKPMLQLAPSDGVNAKETDLSVVLLMDASFSMGYTDDGTARFERSKDAARKMLSLLSPQDRAGIVAYSNRIEAATPNLSNDHTYLANILAGIPLTARPTDIHLALPIAVNLLRQTHSSKKAIVIFSDMAQHGFEFPSGETLEGIKVLYFNPEKSANLWIEEARAERDEVTREWSIESFVRHDTHKDVATWPVTYRTLEQKLSGDLVALTPEGRTKHTVIFNPSGNNTVVNVQLAPDNLDTDNIHFVKLAGPLPYTVWIIDGDPQFGGITAESFYMRNVFPDAKVLTEAEATTEHFALPGIVILANLRNSIVGIDSFIKKGGGAFIFLGSRTGDEFAPEYLPATIGSLIDTPQKLLWLAENHQLRQSLDITGFEWNTITVNQGFALQSKPGAIVLAALSSGWPFILEKRYGEGNVMLCASSGDRDWSNLPGKPIFAPLLKAVGHYLAFAEQETYPLTLRVGETIRHKRISAARILTPDGRMLTPSLYGNEISFSDTEKPGIYTLRQNTTEIETFIVNVDTRRESDLSALTEGEIKKYFNTAVTMGLSRERWEKEFMGILAGKDITKVIILLILFLLAAEVLLANPKIKQ